MKKNQHHEINLLHVQVICLDKKTILYSTSTNTKCSIISVKLLQKYIDSHLLLADMSKTKTKDLNNGLVRGI